jgi:hypothetical protein
LTVKAEARLVDHVTSSDDAKPLKKRATGGARPTELVIRSGFIVDSRLHESPSTEVEFYIK